MKRLLKILILLGGIMLITLLGGCGNEETYVIDTWTGDTVELSIANDMKFNPDTQYIEKESKRIAFIAWYTEELFKEALERYKGDIKETSLESNNLTYIEGEAGNMLLYLIPNSKTIMVLADNSKEKLELCFNSLDITGKV